MASPVYQDVSHIEVGRASDEKIDLASPVDEKSLTVKVSAHEASFDANNGDEALELVGMRRTAQFSEEYNRRLRKKLVCASIYLYCGFTDKTHFYFDTQDWTIPPLCAAVYFTQFL